MDRWIWVCPWVGLLGIVVALWAFGVSLLSALGIGFLLACPAMAVWTWRESTTALRTRDRIFESLTHQPTKGESP